MADSKTASIKKLLKIDEVAEMLNVSKNTLRAWDTKGILKAVRFGERKDRRYEEEKVLQFQQQSI